jgi:hypothetical protein
VSYYVQWVLSQIPAGMKAAPDAYRGALRHYACEIVDGKVRRMRGPIAGLPLGCPDWLEHCEEQDARRWQR